MDAMDSSFAEQLSAAEPRALVGNGDLGEHTAQERNSEATEERPSTLLKLKRKGRFASSVLHVLAATITSLAVVYMLLRCFEKITLSHGQGAAVRLLATGRNGSEDECARNEGPEGDEGVGDNMQSTLPAGLGGMYPAQGAPPMGAPPTPYYPGAPWGGEMHSAQWGQEGMYTGEEEWYPGAVGGTTGADGTMMEAGASSTGFEFPAYPGTSGQQDPTAPYYEGAAWEGGMYGAEWGAEAEHVEAYGGTEEEQEISVGDVQYTAWSSQTEEERITVPRGDPETESEVAQGYWINRQLPPDTEKQAERLLDNIEFFAGVCSRLAEHAGIRQMLRFTAAVMKILIVMLATISLTPDSMEPRRERAGRAILRLADRALELAGTMPEMLRHREEVRMLRSFAECVMRPRPHGEGLPPWKFKKKSIGILGFNTVVNWYLTGIVLGMQYHLHKHGRPLLNEFVGEQIRLLNIVQRHLLGRIVPDGGARWFLEKAQIELQNTYFFSRELSRRASCNPIGSSAEFSKGLKEEIKRAGGLPYTALFKVKYLDDMATTGVQVGRYGENAMYFTEGEGSDEMHIASFASGDEQHGISETPASRPQPMEGASGQTAPASEYFHGARGAGTSSGSWHSPWIQPHDPTAAPRHSSHMQQGARPKQPLPHLHSIPESTGGRYPLQPQHTASPSTLPPTTGAQFSRGHHQRTDVPVAPPSWDPSLAGDGRGREGSALSFKTIDLSHRHGDLLRVPPSAPWDDASSEQQTGISRQQPLLETAASGLGFLGRVEPSFRHPQESSIPSVQHPAHLPSDEYGAVDMRVHSQQQPALPSDSPGAPLVHGPQQVPFGVERWGHYPPMQHTGRLLRPPPGLRHPSETGAAYQTADTPSLPASGFGGYLGPSTLRAPLPQTRDSSLPSSSQHVPRPPPGAGDEPSLSFGPRFDFDHWTSPLVSASQPSSTQPGGGVPHTSPQPSSGPPGIFPQSSGETGSSSGIGFAGPLSGYRSRRPSATSLPPITEPYGPPYPQQHLFMPPAHHHEVAGEDGHLQGTLDALASMDINRDEEPQKRS
ncbi:uncharacterized protein EMH_0039350 [Eimeria mitis]|uniref:Uncharacterized protein n=1 Tax=Eimeria mitis TaxID=44415 RepID=U6K616_9EIME|nr:uncharacterized protein EMH_0039350 [Eimeria mitis]CDJ31652.1 hypothetical protein, conserved [Eimeria mitis]